MCFGHDPSGRFVVRLSLVATPPPAPTQSIEPDPLDVRLHAPTTDTVIVWVDGPIRWADTPLLSLRVRRQLERAVHVILDLASVTAARPDGRCRPASPGGTRRRLRLSINSGRRTPLVVAFSTARKSHLRAEAIW